MFEFDLSIMYYFWNTFNIDFFSKNKTNESVWNFMWIHRSNKILSILIFFGFI